MKLPVLATGGSVWPDALLRLAGGEADVVDGSYADFFYWPPEPEKTANPPQSKYFVEEWKKRGLKWDGVPDGARGFDTVWVMAEAIKIANGSDNRAKLRDALEKVDYPGITGLLKFDKYHDIYSNVIIAGYESGKPVALPCSTYFKDQADIQAYEKRKMP